MNGKLYLPFINLKVRLFGLEIEERQAIPAIEGKSSKAGLSFNNFLSIPELPGWILPINLPI